MAERSYAGGRHVYHALARGTGAGLGATFLVAISLRTGLIGVGPVLPSLTSDLSLSQTQGSVLVALPTALMGLAAFPGGRLADRLGSRSTIAIGLAAVALAGGARAFAPGYSLLVVLTIIFGIGIGISQPALPRLGRGLLPSRVGIATGVYAAGFFTGSVLAAFLTAPVLLPLAGDLEWRLPLAVWGALALGTLLIWLGSLRRWELPATHRSSLLALATPSSATWSPWRDHSAWIVAGIFAGQGLAYYLLVAWLPSVYDEFSVPAREAAALFAFFNLFTFPAMVGLPILSDRLGSRRQPTLLAALVFLVGSLGLALVPAEPGWRLLWPAITGLGVAGLFGMGLLMPADLAPPGQAGAAAGMVLGIGYLSSAAGPVIGGIIKDMTGSFESALATLPVVAVVMVLLALRAPSPGRPFVRSSSTDDIPRDAVPETDL